MVNLLYCSADDAAETRGIKKNLKRTMSYHILSSCNLAIYKRAVYLHRQTGSRSARRPIEKRNETDLKFLLEDTAATQKDQEETSALQLQ